MTDTPTEPEPAEEPYDAEHPDPAHEDMKEDDG